MVNTLIKKGKDLMLKQEENILSAGLLIGASFVASAFLGLLRDRLYSQYFGSEPLFSQLGIFFAADRIPSFIFNLVVAGTLSTAFIPVFSRYLRRDREKALGMASNLLNINLISFMFLALLIFAFSRQLATILGLNTLQREDISLLTKLLRIMLAAQMILIIASFFSSFLQSFKRFLVPALAPIFYNVGIIAFTLIFSKRLGVVAPALGMIFGAIMYLVLVYAFSKSIGFSYRRILNFKDEGILEIIKLTLPRVLSLSANQISLVVDTSLSLFVGPSSLVVFNFAQHLQNLPVNIFGNAISQAALPIMSSMAEEKEKIAQALRSSIKQILFFVLPISVLFIILRLPLVRLTFGAPSFLWSATISTSYTLAFFSVSMAFQSLVFLLNRSFYALCDTVTPVKCAVSSILLNIFSAGIFILVFRWGIWSLALSYSLSSFLNFVLLLHFLNRKLKNVLDIDFLYYTSKMGWASLLTALFLYIPMKMLDNFVFDTTRTLNLLLLTAVTLLLGTFSYMIAAKLFGLEERNLLVKVFRNIFLKGYGMLPKSTAISTGFNKDGSSLE